MGSPEILSLSSKKNALKKAAWQRGEDNRTEIHNWVRSNAKNGDVLRLTYLNKKETGNNITAEHKTVTGRCRLSFNVHGGKLTGISISNTLEGVFVTIPVADVVPGSIVLVKSDESKITNPG